MQKKLKGNVYTIIGGEEFIKKIEKSMSEKQVCVEQVGENLFSFPGGVYGNRAVLETFHEAMKKEANKIINNKDGNINNKNTNKSRYSKKEL